MSDAFRKAYGDDELVQKLLSDDLDWKTFSKSVPRKNLGFKCDNPGCNSQDPKFRCTSCLVSWYCSPTCQKKHWKTHKEKCLMYKEGRLNDHIPSIYDEGEYHYPDRLKPGVEELDWNNQKDPIDDECQICMENTFDPKKSVVLPCRHQFCAGCLIEWQKGYLEFGRGKQADECPSCRQKMPVVEQSLIERADKLLQNAKRETKKVKASAKIGKEFDKDAYQSTHIALCEEALELTEKVLQSKNCQRTIHLTKAEILLEMGQSRECFNATVDFLDLHYSITKDPLVQNCAKFEQAREDHDEDKMDELMKTMTRQLQGMNRSSVPPFLLVNDAYTIQARALMAGQKWGVAKACTQFNLMDYTWKLMADTPWIAYGDLAGKVAKRNIEYMMNIGIASYNMGEYVSALQPLSCAVMMNLQSKVEFDSYRYLAMTYKEIGDWEEVLKVISAAAMYQSHCEQYGRQTHQLFKEMLKEWHTNHRNNETPVHNFRKIDILRN